MRRNLLPLLFTVALVVSCSGGDEKQDSGVTPDQAVRDQAITDQAVADKMPPDSPPKKKVHEYLPAGSEVSGWSEDVAAGKAGPDSGYTKLEIEALINGSHDPYHTEGCDSFAQEQYKKTFSSTCSATAEIKIWECPTSATAKKMHDYNKGKTVLTWSTISGVKDAGIIANDSPLWRALAHKSGYVIKMDATATAAPCFTTLQADVASFVKVLTGNLP